MQNKMNPQNSYCIIMVLSLMACIFKEQYGEVEIEFSKAQLELISWIQKEIRLLLIVKML